MKKIIEEIGAGLAFIFMVVAGIALILVLS